MVPHLDNLKKVMKQFQYFLDEIERPETQENVDFILKRLKNVMFCLVYGKDQSGEPISRTVTGEFLLKTWRISREPEILGSVLEHVPEKLDLYNALCDKILSFAKLFLGDRFRELYRIEEYSTIIIKYLLETSITFNQVVQMEIVSDYKKNLNRLSERMEELAFMIYNGINDRDGSVIAYSRISTDIYNTWNQIKNVNWKQMLSPGMRFRSHELEKICTRFGAIMFPYMSKQGEDTREIDGMVPKASLKGEHEDEIIEETEPEEITAEDIKKAEIESTPPIFDDEQIKAEPEIIKPEVSPTPKKTEVEEEPAFIPNAPEVVEKPKAGKLKGKKLLSKTKTPINQRMASRKDESDEVAKEAQEISPVPPAKEEIPTPTAVTPEIEMPPEPVIPEIIEEQKKSAPVKSFNVTPKRFEKPPADMIAGRKPVLDTAEKTDRPDSKGTPKFGPIKISTFSLKSLDYFKKKASVTQSLAEGPKQHFPDTPPEKNVMDDAKTNVITSKAASPAKTEKSRTQSLSIKGLLEHHGAAMSTETAKIKEKPAPVPPPVKQAPPPPPPPTPPAPPKMKEEDAPTQSFDKLADELDEMLPFGKSSRGAKGKTAPETIPVKTETRRPLKKPKTTLFRPAGSKLPRKEAVPPAIQPQETEPPAAMPSISEGGDEYSLPPEYKEYQNKLLSSIKEAFRKDREETEEKPGTAKSGRLQQDSGPIKTTFLKQSYRDANPTIQPPVLSEPKTSSIKPLKTAMLPKLKKLAPGVPPSTAFKPSSPKDAWKEQQETSTKVEVPVPIKSMKTSGKAVEQEIPPKEPEKEPAADVPLGPSGNEEEIMTNYPVILQGNLKFDGPVKKVPRRDGKVYYKDLRVVCRFPEIYSQVTFRGANFIATPEGDFSIKAFLSGFTIDNAPTKVKLQFYHSGFKKFSTDFVKISGNPPRAKVLNVVLKKEG